MYLKNHGDVNAFDPNGGMTALHFSAACGSVDVTRLLLEHNADIGVMCQGGYTALHSACFAGNKDIVQILIDNGASVEAVDEVLIISVHF